MNFVGFVIAVAMVVAVAQRAAALEHVSFDRDGKTIQVAGKLLVEAADGGVLLLDHQGILWTVQPNEIVSRDRDDVEYEPWDARKTAEVLLAEMPDGFRIHSTAHYVICFNTTPAYAEWCGALYERLYRAFQTFWTRRGFELRDPQLPLVALVFDSKQSYARYAQSELGEATASIIGYYSLRTNRVTMYDLTGVDGLVGARRRISSAAHVNQILSQPEAERTVATIIHEATHQLAFNCGMQARYADIPLWVSEGIAVYFEPPDLRSSKGWRRIGTVNRVRWSDFRKYAPTRPARSLESLVADDSRFRQVKTASAAYGEAWALNYYLIKSRPDDYVAYLRMLAAKPPLIFDTPEERIAQFKAVFGDDVAQLDADFLRVMARVKPD